eukprot:Rmarinus@m.24504
MAETATLHVADVVVLVLSLLAVFLIGLVVTYRKKNSSADDFFLSGRTMAWWAVGASLFASNIGTEHFVGQAGAAAASGMAVGLFEWTAALLLIMLGWIFTPVYLRMNLSTVPEYFETRFSPACRCILTGLSLFAYIVTKISSSLFAGAIVLDVVLGWSMWTSVPLIIIATGMYTIGGGLEAVIYTDALQTLIFLVGGIIGMFIALDRVGYQSGLETKLERNGLDYFMHMIRAPTDIEYPATAMFTGQVISSVWYWCIDQVIVQRVLSARSLSEARVGVVFAGYLKILPVFMIVFPGMAARAMFEECKAGRDGFDDWCETELDDSDEADKAYPYLVIKEFPAGVVGLMLAAMFAAMMSSLSSVFNSASAVFTMDIYKRFLHRDAPEQQLVHVGRLATFVMIVLSLLWLPVIDLQPGQMYIITMSAQSHIYPPIAMVFLLGFFWRRVNAEGALAGIIGGSGFSLIRFAISLMYMDECEDSRSGTDDRTVGGPWFACMQFLHFALLAVFITTICIVVVTLRYPPPSDEQIRTTTIDLDKWVSSFRSQSRSLSVYKTLDEECEPGTLSPASTGSSSLVGDGTSCADCMHLLSKDVKNWFAVSLLGVMAALITYYA